MDFVYVLKEVEVWEADNILSIHKTYEGACTAWYTRRDMEIAFYTENIKDIAREMKNSHRSISQAIDDTALIQKYESDVERMKRLKPEDTLDIDGRRLIIEKIEVLE